MIRIRNRRFLFIGIPLILALFVVDEGRILIARRGGVKGEGSGLQLKVRSETGAAGHNTIGIDETALQSGRSGGFLYFSTLGQWEYDADKKPPCPEPIRALDGRDFDCVGFMYPLETGKQITDFCLLRSTQTCCYGPRPQFNQYILVEMKEPVKFERLAPVMVHGRFFVDPKPSDGYIYRMEGETVRRVGGDRPQINPARAANQADLPLFDFDWLVKAKGSRSETIPDELRRQSGKQVVLGGYCVSRSEGAPPRLIVGKTWWDGVAQGTPPTIYNAVAVLPADEGQVPPIWQPFQVFTGVLHVTKQPSRWNKEGIVQLRDAQLGVPGVTGPARRLGAQSFIPIWAKLAAIAACLLLAFRWQARTEDSPDGN